MARYAHLRVRNTATPEVLPKTWKFETNVTHVGREPGRVLVHKQIQHVHQAESVRLKEDSDYEPKRFRHE